MKMLSILCLAFTIGVSTTAALARGGMGGMGSSHMSAMGGGAFGTSAATPGTNSLGTALSSSGTGTALKGPLLGTSPGVDREEVKVDKMIDSICRGC